MKLVAAALTLLLLSFNVSADNHTGLPSFGETILKEQFPEYKESADVERGLRRYRFQLESFREDILEGYNGAVLEYGLQLVDADEKLELDRKLGRITSDVYLERHDYLRKEFIKSRGSREYMEVYYKYLKKYKSEAKWVNGEIAIEEKKRFKF